jgi:hypothetical protein
LRDEGLGFRVEGLGFTVRVCKDRVRLAAHTHIHRHIPGQHGREGQGGHTRSEQLCAVDRVRVRDALGGCLSVVGQLLVSCLAVVAYDRVYHPDPT